MELVRIYLERMSYSSLGRVFTLPLRLRLLPHHHLLASSRCLSNSNLTRDFNPQKVLILTKLSRFDFEKMRHSNHSEAELESALRKRGSDYNTLVYHHYIHKVINTNIKS